MREDYEDDDEEGEGEEGDGPAGIALGVFIEESYAGDPRFEVVELAAPGQSEGEDFRVRLVVNDDCHFFVSVNSADGFARVGLATDSVETSEAIERAILDSGNSMTEFLEEAMGAEGELENEVQHFHDDAYYFCSELPYDGPEQLKSRALRDEVLFYLDGYLAALLDLLGTEE